MVKAKINIMKNRQNILMIVLVIIIIITAYIWYGYVRSKPSEIVVRSSEGVVPEAQGLLTLLQAIEKVRIDTSFFEDPVYNTLEDLSPPIIVPETRGRANPFASLQ